ncbi:MAG: endolytic transglycosylase MltG [Pseudomonadota bacterium]
MAESRTRRLKPRPPRRAGPGLARLLTRALLLVLVAGLAVAGGVAWWLQRPLPLPAAGAELSIEPGTAPRQIARDWVAAGVDVDERLLYAWFRVSGQARQIRAGSYRLQPGDSARDLLQRMVAGDSVMQAVRLIDGWTFRRWREELARAPGLRHEAAHLDDAALMAALGLAGRAPEGRFLPDTYLYGPGVSELTVMRRAAQAMQRTLDAAWAQRAPDLPLRSPDEALILASLVEKETGLAADRGRIAGVFINRLRLGMPLQTDPSVIYGLGPAFDGDLRRADLRRDTPWNTYTRRGLPPTPIAMPGRAALQAALHPEATRALYFVARGDGSSVFSDDLAAHNRAVDRYQRRASPP